MVKPVDDYVEVVNDEDLRRLDELTTCPCAYCSHTCSSYEELYSCQKRIKWKYDMDRKYYRK